MSLFSNPIHEFILSVFCGFLNSHDFLQNIKSSLDLMRKFGGERLKESVDRLESIVSEVVDMELVDNLPDILGLFFLLSHYCT